MEQQQQKKRTNERTAARPDLGEATHFRRTRTKNEERRTDDLSCVGVCFGKIKEKFNQ
jgi:hypothetical protein